MQYLLEISKYKQKIVIAYVLGMLVWFGHFIFVNSFKAATGEVRFVLASFFLALQLKEMRPEVK